MRATVIKFVSLSLCFPFVRPKKKKNQKVGGQITKVFSVFVYFVLYFKGMQNSIYFYKGISLLVISVNIIVSWFYRISEKILCSKILISNLGDMFV